MARLFGLKFWIFCAVYLATGVALLQTKVQGMIHEQFPYWEQALDGFFTLSMTATLVWLTLAFLLWKPIWRSIWKFPLIGAWLSDHVFPDLNGEWEMEIHSNWPIVNAMRTVAKDSAQPRFDVLQEGMNLPALSVTKLPTIIEQGWSKINVVVDKNNLTPLLRSHTLSVELLKEECGYPKRVAWIFRQENSSTEHTDEQNFLGAALLSVSKDGRILEGQYWNNRQWHKGLNVAGKIIVRRVN